MAKNERKAAAPKAGANPDSDLGALSPQAPLTESEQAAAKAEKVKAADTFKQRMAKAAAMLATKEAQADFGPGVGAIIPYTEKGSGKIVPAIVSELRLRPKAGGKPGEKEVEAVCLVLSAHTSRTYTVHIPVKEA